MNSENRTTRFLDGASVFFFGLMALTGLALARIQPELTLRLRGIPMDVSVRFLGISIGTWIAFHRTASALALLTLVPNVFLEWETVLSLARRKTASGSVPRALAGVIATVTLVFFAALLAMPRSRLSGAGAVIPVELQSSMQTKTLDRLTLTDIERNMRVPQAYMRQSLRLPADAPANLPLSFLMQRYHFTFNSVQQAVFNYHNRPAREPNGR